MRDERKPARDLSALIVIPETAEICGAERQCTGLLARIILRHNSFHNIRTKESMRRARNARQMHFAANSLFLNKIARVLQPAAVISMKLCPEEMSQC